MKKTSAFDKSAGRGFGKSSAPAPGAFSKADRIKLTVMTLLLVAVGVGWFVSRAQQRELAEREAAELRAQAGGDETLYVPKFDFATLSERVDDSEQGQRKVETDVLDEMLDYASLLNTAQFDALESKTLDAELAAKLRDAPDELRGAAVRARGTITSIFHRQPEGRRAYYEGSLELQDGTPVGFATRLMDEDSATEQPLSVGTFARVDGVYLKPQLIGSGTEETVGPFIVGPRGVVSFESVGKVEQIPAEVIEGLESDSLTYRAPESSVAKWTFLAYARDTPAGEVDWENAPELGNEQLTQLLSNPDAYVGKPYRIPISRNMGTYIKAIPENPARLERITTGWIGNTSWTAGNGLVRFDAPSPPPEGLQDSNLITARGFFMRNHQYEPARKNTLALAPHFVLYDLQKFVPVQDRSIGVIFVGVLIVTIALILLIVFLLTRDRKQAAALQEKLVERRRKRRDRETAPGLGSGGQPAS